MPERVFDRTAANGQWNNAFMLKRLEYFQSARVPLFPDKIGPAYPRLASARDG
jgi:hypothetical protein